jgi:hypothetical protein
MRHVDGTFAGARDISIYHQSWLPDVADGTSARAVLFIAHEIYNEPERVQVFADLAAWLETHLRSSGGNG